MTDHIWVIRATDETLDFIERLLTDSSQWVEGSNADEIAAAQEAAAVLGIVKGWRNGPADEPQPAGEEEMSADQRLLLAVRNVMERTGVPMEKVTTTTVFAAEDGEDGFSFTGHLYHYPTSGGGANIADSNLHDLLVEDPEHAAEVQDLLTVLDAYSAVYVTGEEWQLNINWITGSVYVDRL